MRRTTPCSHARYSPSAFSLCAVSAIAQDIPAKLAPPREGSLVGQYAAKGIQIYVHTVKGGASEWGFKAPEAELIDAQGRPFAKHYAGPTWATRPEIDKNRIVVHGQSFGAYWAAKLAHTEAKRLAGAIAQSPPIHRTFQADFFRNRMYTREYLFDLLPASLFVYGLNSTDELLRFLPKMSLQAQELLGKPTTSILVVGGTKDTQVPIDDLELLINSGREPREAWINPAGGHMGRTASTWPDPVIFRQVILPWEVRHLSQKPTD